MAIRGRVVVGLGYQLLHGRRTKRTQGAQDLVLALESVNDETVDDLGQLVHDEAVPGCDVRNVLRKQRIERSEVLAHVAVGRTDDDRRALHDVIAREEQLLFFEQIAELVGRVSRRVQHSERATGRRDPLTVSQGCVRLKRSVRLWDLVRVDGTLDFIQSRGLPRGNGFVNQVDRVPNPRVEGIAK